MSYKEKYTEQLRKNFLQFTENAFNSLPKMENPRILELGCGSGLVTIKLAELSDGNITAIDIDQSLLDNLTKKLNERNLKNRITIIRMDLLKNNFPDEMFDLIWEEGVIQIIGFEESFKACHRILKPGGYLVLGQAIRSMERNLDLLKKYDFELVNQLNWPEACWWTLYYEPLEKKLKESPDLFENFSTIESEINMIKANIKYSDCAHYIIRKKEI